MSRTVTFTVTGRPAPKGSRTYLGPGRSIPSSRFEKAFASAVAAEASACSGTLPPPYRVSIRFAIEQPKRPKYPYPVQSDVDKLVRNAIDGLVNGRLIVDDAHITEVYASKQFTAGDVGATITVESLA